MKKIIFVLALTLAGCSSVPVMQTKEVSYLAGMVSESSLEDITELQPVVSAPASPTPTTSAAPIKSTEIIESAPVKAVETTPKKIVSKTLTVIKAVKVALDTTEEQPKESPKTVAKESPPPAPNNNPFPATGAKLQVLGIDLEFWVGNNDNWSTVWKLIVLILVVYGGLRIINLLISRGEKVLAA